MAVARPTRSLFLPLGCAVALGALSLFPGLSGQTRVQWTFLAAALAIGVWNGLLLARARRGRRLPSAAVALRPQHTIQACAQGALFLYWGWYWREVYDAAHLLAAQLLFAWAFDFLLSWTRRDVCTLGLGTVPIVFSINLFLWFRAEWFFLQFLLIAVGLVVKELWRRERDGRRGHVFNPSSFPLALCSLGLIATGATDLTWGQEIATTLNDAPHIYLAIFLISLPGQIRFGVAWTTLSAVLTMYLFGLVHLALVGTYYFVDAYIPIAVFLGMHLLVTDPATSPRSAPGRVVFGAAYALSVIALYGLLGAVGAPRFYDKLLAVPLLNLLVPAIERLVRRRGERFDQCTTRQRTEVEFAVDRYVVDTWPAGRSGLGALRHRMSGGRLHLRSVGVWTMVFVGMSAAGGVGDTHRGQWVTFWERACAEDLPNGCRQFGLLVSTYCDRGSGWACNRVRRAGAAGRSGRRSPTRRSGAPATRASPRAAPTCSRSGRHTLRVRRRSWPTTRSYCGFPRVRARRRPRWRPIDWPATRASRTDVDRRAIWATEAPALAAGRRRPSTGRCRAVGRCAGRRPTRWSC